MVFPHKRGRRLGWLEFPGLLRYFALLDAMVFLLGLFNPKLGLMLMLDWQLVWQGEYWRLATGVFAASGFGTGFSIFIALLFKYFMVRILFLFSDALEDAWGVLRTSLFCYAGVLGAMAASLVEPGVGVIIGWLFYASVFFAFATLFPRVEFRLFLVLPVQVRFLALLTAVPLVVSGFSSLPWWGVLALSFGNYIFWAGIPALRGKKAEFKAAARRKRFAKAQEPAGGSLYRCTVCGRTDSSHPELEFRVGADGDDYCMEHLPAKETVERR